MPFSYYRTPLVLLGIVVLVCIATVWDMFLALMGAMVAVPLFYRLHDRSMARLDKFDGLHLTGRITG